MAGGSNKHMVCLIRVGKDPEWSIAENLGKQVDVYERTYWEKNVDKQNGSYTKFTGKDKVVSRERFVEKSTVKTEDNDGYAEYYREGKNSKNKAITNYPK